MLCDHLPRQRFALLPTPLEHLQRLSASLGGPAIYIKRDDRSGLSFGGNKPRIFEFVLGDALHEGCDTIIASAGVQSNHLREVTSAANRLGLKSIIVLCGATGNEEPQGNLLLFKLLGAEIHTLANKDPFSQELMDKLDQLTRREEAKGRKPYVLHRNSKSGMLGSVAHVNAAEELTGQFAEMGISQDYLSMGTGSGSTTGGYVLGLKHLKSRTRVLGISLVEPNDSIVPTVQKYASRAAEYLGFETRVEASDFLMHDAYIGPGHGVLTQEVTEAIRLVARTEGIFLDPTYNGKAMVGLMDLIQKGTLTREHSVVLVHTGGLPALFVNNLALADEPGTLDAKSA